MIHPGKNQPPIAQHAGEMGINHAPTGIVGPSQRQIAVIVQKGFVQIIRYHIGKASVLICQRLCGLRSIAVV